MKPMSEVSRDLEMNGYTDADGERVKPQYLRLWSVTDRFAVAWLRRLQPNAKSSHSRRSSFSSAYHYGTATPPIWVSVPSMQVDMKASAAARVNMSVATSTPTPLKAPSLS